jgi:hypothetical protein
MSGEAVLCFTDILYGRDLDLDARARDDFFINLF